MVPIPSILRSGVTATSRNSSLFHVYDIIFSRCLVKNILQINVCKTVTYNLCLISDSLMGENLSEYSYENPFCIPRVQFCDGKKDCLSGMDEKQIGYGFKCPLKERPNTCLVPDYFLCDGIADCQNNADLCPEITKPISGVTPSNKSEPAFPDTFNCLNHKKNVTIFQTQVSQQIIFLIIHAKAIFCGIFR